MNSKRGITLIALVVTIVILLILAAVTIAFVLGPDGMLAKARDTGVASRYATIMDKVHLRDAELAIAFNINQEGEHHRDFIERMESEGFITDQDSYDDITYRKIFLGRIDANNYKYTINVPDGTMDGKSIFDEIALLPNSDDNPELKKMKLKVRTWDVYEEVELPISNAANLKINWDVENNPGEENFITVGAISNPKHTYTAPGEYIVQIDGTAEPGVSFGKPIHPYILEFLSIIKQVETKGSQYEMEEIQDDMEDFMNRVKNGLEDMMDDFAQKYGHIFESEDFDPDNFDFGMVLPGNIVEIIHWGENDFTKFLSLGIQLEGNIPIPSRESFRNVTDFEATFALAGFKYLIKDMEGFDFMPRDAFNIPELFEKILLSSEHLYSVPYNLFINATNVKNMNYVFALSTLDRIPSKLFLNTPLVESFEGTFSMCLGLTSAIPNDLFRYTTEVKSFTGTFALSVGMVGKIPSNLFSSCTKAESFFATFANCPSLSGPIPSNLFARNTKAKSFAFTFAFATFYGNIPNNLFVNCPDVEYFSGTFAKCQNLTGGIPSFDNNLKVKNFANAFLNCYELTGEAPALWLRSNVEGFQCFADCVELTDYSYIPEYWRRTIEPS